MTNTQAVKKKKPDNPTTAEETAPTYAVSIVTSADSYDPRHHCYVPAKALGPLTWEQVVNVITTAGLTAEKDGLGIIPSQIKKHRHHKTGLYGRWRTKKGCVETSLLVLDVENHPMGSGSKADVVHWYRAKFPATTALIYSTWNHGVPEKWVPSKPRIRVVIPLARPVDSQTEYAHLWSWAVAHCDGALDDGTGDPCRLSYTLRLKNPEAQIEPWSIEVGGLPLDVDCLPDGQSVPEIREAKEAREKARRAKQAAIREERAKAIDTGDLKFSQRRARAYAEAALDGACDTIRRASEGDRHRTLIKAAVPIGAMVMADMLPENEAISALSSAGYSVLPPDRHGEVERTVTSALGYASEPFDTTMFSDLTKQGLKNAINWDDIDTSTGIIGLPASKKEGGSNE